MALQTITIYGLCDPRTNELRYIGKANNATQRIRAHLCESSNHGTHKLHWIRQLKAQGLKPELIIIEEVPSHAWSEAETFWIQYMRFLGCRLTNASDGGYGAINLSQETRQRISKARQGIQFSQEHLRNLSISHKGQKPTNLEQLAIISKQKKSPNHRLAISRGLLGHPVSPEARRNMSEAAKKRHERQRAT